MELSGKITFNRIAVKLIDIEKKTKSGIILADSKEGETTTMDSFTDHPHQGEVVAIGTSVSVCKKGDVVLIRDGASPLALNDKGTLFALLYESDVLLVREV